MHPTITLALMTVPAAVTVLFDGASAPQARGGLADRLHTLASQEPLAWSSAPRHSSRLSPTREDLVAIVVAILDGEADPIKRHVEAWMPEAAPGA